MFSPYYHWAGRRDPTDHCAVNVCLYGPGVGRWAMTERGRSALSRSTDHYSLGPSSLAWDGTTLTLDLAEIAVPIPRGVRGRIRLIPEGLGTRAFALDPEGAHSWMPLAPSAAVEVDFSEPALSFRGHGYLDTNGGTVPFAASFRSWDWSRANLDGDGSLVLYDTVGLDGARRSIATRFARNGRDEDVEPPPRMQLPRTLWGVARGTQAERGEARVVRTLEDTPFYARSEIAARLLGAERVSMHESLSVTRFDTPIVRAMLPFRMPRRGG